MIRTAKHFLEYYLLKGLGFYSPLVLHYYEIYQRFIYLFLLAKKIIKC